MANYEEEFLDRMLSILAENNPEYEELLDGALKSLGESIQELIVDLRKRTLTAARTSVRGREGMEKTAVLNFMDICEKMNKEPEHVMKFILAQMGTTGSLDGQQRLVLKGKFEPSNFEGILKTYIKDHVSFF